MDTSFKLNLWGVLVIITYVFLLLCIKCVLYFSPLDESFFAILFITPHTITTSSLVKWSVSSLAEFVITSIPVLGLTYPVTSYEFPRWLGSFSAHPLVWLSPVRMTLCFFFTKALSFLSPKSHLLSHPIFCATSVESCKETFSKILVTPHWILLKRSPCMASITFGMRKEYASTNRGRCCMSKLLTHETNTLTSTAIKGQLLMLQGGVSAGRSVWSEWTSTL